MLVVGEDAAGETRVGPDLPAAPIRGKLTGRRPRRRSDLLPLLRDDGLGVVEELRVLLREGRVVRHVPLDGIDLRQALALGRGVLRLRRLRPGPHQVVLAVRAATVGMRHEVAGVVIQLPQVLLKGRRGPTVVVVHGRVVQRLLPRVLQELQLVPQRLLERVRDAVYLALVVSHARVHGRPGRPEPRRRRGLPRHANGLGLIRRLTGHGCLLWLIRHGASLARSFCRHRCRLRPGLLRVIVHEYLGTRSMRPWLPRHSRLLRLVIRDVLPRLLVKWHDSPHGFIPNATSAAAIRSSASVTVSGNCTLSAQDVSSDGA